MADEKNAGVANIVYSIVGNGRKDEIEAITSLIFRSPENYDISDIESLMDSKRVDELARGKFSTTENETSYKQALLISSAIGSGRMESKEVDVVIPKELVKDYKEDGALENLKKVGTAGRFSMYAVK